MISRVESERTCLAVDLGGTHLRVARVTASGEPTEVVKVNTPDGGPDAILNTVADAASDLGHAPDREPVGVAAPGPLDAETGVVYATPNLQGFDDYPLVARWTERLGGPVWLHNDANLAAFGEYRFGAGAGHDPLIYLTISTGVGGGLIVDGRIWTGRFGLAGELGHVIVQAGGPACNFGHPGCLEGLASGTAIGKRGREAAEAGRSDKLANDSGEITAKSVARAAEGGDPVAAEIYRDAGRFLGLGGFINALDPSRIVLGGGVIAAWDLFEASMRGGTREVVMTPEVRSPDVVPAATGDDAGLLGAAAYALMRAAEETA